MLSKAPENELALAQLDQGHFVIALQEPVRNGRRTCYWGRGFIRQNCLLVVLWVNHEKPSCRPNRIECAGPPTRRRDRSTSLPAVLPAPQSSIEPGSPG